MERKIKREIVLRYPEGQSRERNKARVKRKMKINKEREWKDKEI